MGWPQITIIVLWALGLGIHIARHGQVQKDAKGSALRYNWVVMLISRAILLWILWAGGFFG